MERLQRYRRMIDRALQDVLPPAAAQPHELHRAMRYCALSSAKRLRPILTLAVAECLGGALREAMPSACAIEIVHTYSLVHDDLPSMDDAETRRGRLSCHRKFGEAMAILTGDALLTTAFEIVAGRTGDPRMAALLIGEIARAIGSRGMIRGQVMDIRPPRRMTAAHLRTTHRTKTALLFAAASRCGAICADATPTTIDLFGDFGETTGLAFQIVDDILDADADGRGTAGGESCSYPALHGMTKAIGDAEGLLRRAMAIARKGTRKPDDLLRIVDLIVKRLSDAASS
ncbi:MAG: hypothetical protein A2Z34_11295 [Planctomycetes bacterium RBG_16_59_8]|nr:MAG: hypothetical protein A2Z34_11295 [Planctomycetes bacterium RBG_16_59_8]